MKMSIQFKDLQVTASDRQRIEDADSPGPDPIRAADSWPDRDHQRRKRSRGAVSTRRAG